MRDQPLPHLPPVDPARAARPAPTTMTPEVLAALLADGDDELAAWTLTNALAERTRPEVFDGLLRDAMALVGTRWREGRWTVADEHLASQTLVRALERIRGPAGPESRIGPLAVLAAVAGEMHAIGLTCLEQVLREGGWTIANLGADVPAADLGRFLARNHADLLALTASLPDREAAIREAIAAGRAAVPVPGRLPIMLGGALARDVDLVATLGVDWAGESLVGADRYAAGLLSATTGGSPS